MDARTIVENLVYINYNYNDWRTNYWLINYSNKIINYWANELMGPRLPGSSGACFSHHCVTIAVTQWCYQAAPRGGARPSKFVCTTNKPAATQGLRKRKIPWIRLANMAPGLRKRKIPWIRLANMAPRRAPPPLHHPPSPSTTVARMADCLPIPGTLRTRRNVDQSDEYAMGRWGINK